MAPLIPLFLVLSVCVLLEPCFAGSGVPAAGAWLESSRLGDVHYHQQQQSRWHDLPKLDQQLTADLAEHPAAAAAAAAADQKITARRTMKVGRQLQQITGLASFAAGAQYEASRRVSNTVTALAQLANFYGLEGFGIRQRLGAIPGPGALELLATVGPAALPGPEGFTAGFLAAAAENARTLASPVDTAVVRDVARAAATTLGLESGKVGAAGPVGGVGGLESIRESLTSGLSKLGSRGSLLGEKGRLNSGGQTNPSMQMQVAAGKTGANAGAANGLQADMGTASMQGSPAALQAQADRPGMQNNVGLAAMQGTQGVGLTQGSVGIASGPGSVGAGSNGLPARTMTAEAGQPAAALTAGQDGRGSVATGAGINSRGINSGGVLKGASSIWHKLTGSLAPAAMPAAAAAAAAANKSESPSRNDGGLVSVTPGWKGIDTITGQVPGQNVTIMGAD